MKVCLMRHGVHQSNSLWVKAAFEPSCSGLNAPQPLARGEGGVKHSIGRVGRVPHDAGRTASAPADIDVHNGRKAAAGDLHPLQRLPVSSRAVPIPGGDGEGECTLHHTPVERCRALRY